MKTTEVWIWLVALSIAPAAVGCGDESSTDPAADIVETDASSDAAADAVDDAGTDVATDVDGDTWELSGPDPGPMHEQGPAPQQYADVPPAGADGDLCVTGEWWNGGNQGSYDMNPGEDCIGCHRTEGEGPVFSFAGTVFGEWDDEDDCRGVEVVVIDIIDANGDVAVTMTSRASGNFTSQIAMRNIELPYTARLRYDGRERYMVTPQVNGSCNSCHAEVPIGGAPGRVILP